MPSINRKGLPALRKVSSILLLPLCLTMASCASADSKKPDSPIVAKVSTAPFVIAGMPTTISTEGSIVPTNVKVNYAYDVDGDGQYETTPEDSYQASLAYSFKETGKHKVGVKISDEAGQSSTADIDFTVYPADYLSADKKSELKAAVSYLGGKAIVQTQVDSPSAKISLRVYLNGKDQVSAAKSDIKIYGPWDTAGGSTVTHEVDVTELTPGKYSATVFSDGGPEKHLTFVIK